MDYDQLVSSAKGRKTILINGYVGLGYQHPYQVRAKLKEIMAGAGDNLVIVNPGTHAGIGLVNDWIPEIARELGYKDVKTATIISRNVADRNLAPVDWACFVPNAPGNWRPESNSGEDLQLKFLKDTGGRMISFQGGRLTGETVGQALKDGLPVDLYHGGAFAPNQKMWTEAKALNPGQVYDGTAEYSSLSQTDLRKMRNLTVRRVDSPPSGAAECGSSFNWLDP